MEKYIEEFNKWKSTSLEDIDLTNELNQMDDETIIKEAFYKDLSFGTAGLRGVIGVGINKMNIYVVRRATQALSMYLLKHFTSPSVAIGYDSRNKSTLFAKETARVLSANGVKVYLYDRLMPVPLLSFATRYTNSQAGIMITASHNPKIYNGYKVYNDEGCQINEEFADEILENINSLDTLNGYKIADFNEMVQNGTITIICEKIIKAYYDYCTTLLFNHDRKNINIVYTPLYGAGFEPVTHMFENEGYENVTLVKEQVEPNGDFPTAPYPNPETKEAMALGMEYLKNYKADILLATDPDCDRCNAAINHHGDYVLLNGNELGCLLLDYICLQRISNNTMPNDPFCVKSIVSTDAFKLIADKYNVKLIETLTGFKYIGAVIEEASKIGKEDSFIFGFEESIGFLSGTGVRDKDAVNSTLLIAEMANYYKEKNMTLIDRLDEIYNEIGFAISDTISYQFPGIDGMDKMKNIMSAFRNNFANDILEIVSYSDYSTRTTYFKDNSKKTLKLPKADVLSYVFEDANKVIVRPSGTEPKLKVYYLVSADCKNHALEKKEYLKNLFDKFIKIYE